MTGLNPTAKNIIDQDGLLSRLNDNKQLILRDCLKNFTKISDLKIKFGFEVEFYIRPLTEQCSLDADLANSFLNLVNRRCSQIEIFDKIELEKGDFQCEIKTKPVDDVESSLGQLNLIFQEVESCCKELNLISIFDARPFEDDCANAFQVNFSLIDGDENNVFANRSKVAAQIADFITFYLDELLLFCNEKDEDYTRYDSIYNKSIFQKGKFVAPTAKSWGYDNRSCAIRVLNSRELGDRSRIEVRAPSNSCDKYLLIASVAILLGQFYSLEKYDIQNECIYGNSFDAKYEQRAFPTNYKEALDGFFEGEVVFKEMLKIIAP